MPRPTCYIDDCERPHHGQGLCKYHYNIQRKAALKTGKWENVLVDATPFKKRIREFLELGYNYSMLQALTGIDRSTMLRAVNGDFQTVIADNIERLERVPLLPLYLLWRTDIGVDYRVPSYLSSRRIRALMAKGYTTTRIAEESGLHRQTIGRLAHREVPDTVMRSNLVGIVEAYERLWDQEPPMPYRHSDLTRYQKWPLPMEWDDDEIDLPGTEKKAHARASIRLGRKRQRAYTNSHRKQKRASEAAA